MRASELGVTRTALPPTADHYDTLCRWILDECNPASHLLDIGAGDGDDDYARRLDPHVGRYVGIDPDPLSVANPALDEWLPMTLEEYSTSPSAHRFDVAVAVYVAEHVARPTEFLQAARRCLRDGGSLYLLTVNIWHYFAPLAKITGVLGIDERVLQALRRAPPETHDAAHFPVYYRMNSVGALRRHGARAGFERMEVRSLDNPCIFETYFPGRLAAFPHAYSRAVTSLNLTALYGILVCKLVATSRPADD